jgi:tRNA A37 threonylcarbamoyladenosine synthetase subunit TsaC/SUA5/YrdC
LFVRQCYDGAITLPISRIVNTAKKPVVGVRVPTQGQFHAVCAQPINPILHFSGLL